MTKQEYTGRIVATFVANWPHVQLPDVSIAKFYDDLKDLPVDQVQVTVETLAREGREFPPNGGLIRKRHAELLFDAPPWGEVKRALELCLAYGERVYAAGEYHNARADRLSQCAMFTQTYVARYGWREITRCLTGDAGDAQGRDRYKAMTTRVERAVAWEGLPSAGLGALERAKAERIAIGTGGKPKLLGEFVKDALPSSEEA